MLRWRSKHQSNLRAIHNYGIMNLIMNTITIPKNLIKNDDLVVLPRKEYEQLARFWANAEALPKRTKTVIEKGFKEISNGEFLTSKQVKDALGL